MTSPEPRPPGSPPMPLLELRNVSAGYGPFRAVFDVSLEIPEGRVLALLGSNGAGKTTIARIASGSTAEVLADDAVRRAYLGELV